MRYSGYITNIIIGDFIISVDQNFMNIDIYIKSLYL